MRKPNLAIGSLTSLLLATSLIAFDADKAMACSGGSGSSLGSGSVKVCVGSSTSTPGSSTTQVITKTVTVPVASKPKPAPKPIAKPAPKPAASSAPKPAPVSCPSPAQLASMPRSSDAAERWVESLCSPAPKSTSSAKPASKPLTKTRTITITELITIETPGFASSASDEVEFFPNPLVASVHPAKVLRIGQIAKFSSNATSHYGSALVLGIEAQVHFVPLSLTWRFSDGLTQQGSTAERAFSKAGIFFATAEVNYSVSYRLLGESAWESVPGYLSVKSNTLELKVGASNLKTDPVSQGALLVGQDCIGRASAFGCGI
jgi:hypothetical protein